GCSGTTAPTSRSTAAARRPRIYTDEGLAPLARFDKAETGPTPTGSLRSPHAGPCHHEATVPSGRRLKSRCQLAPSRGVVRAQELVPAGRLRERQAIVDQLRLLDDQRTVDAHARRPRDQRADVALRRDEAVRERRGDVLRRFPDRAALAALSELLREVAEVDEVLHVVALRVLDGLRDRAELAVPERVDERAGEAVDRARGRGRAREVEERQRDGIAPVRLRVALHDRGAELLRAHRRPGSEVGEDAVVRPAVAGLDLFGPDDEPRGFAQLVADLDHVHE